MLFASAAIMEILYVPGAWTGLNDCPHTAGKLWRAM
jgi:hypothetical protein